MSVNPDDLFDGPGSITSIKWEEYEGRLFLITPRRTIADHPTLNGPAEVIRADVVILDGPEAPVRTPDTIVYPKILQGQIRANVGTGRSNLGRLGKGERRPGQSAPWMLGEPTDADKQVARAYLQKNPPAPTPPANTTPPATAAPPTGGEPPF